MNTTYSYLRHIQQCMLAILVLVLCLVGTVPVTTAQPAAADYAAIDAYVERQMRDLHIPGLALGIVEGDQIVHLKGFGVAGSDGRPVTPQTPFQLTSLGKPMTAVAIMQLVEAGKLDLDAPVQRYLPAFHVADETASAQITVRHLLYHTSGLPAAGIEEAFNGDERPDALEQGVRALRSVQLNRPVGASYQYSNAVYSTLGLLIQEVSGQSYEAYMRAHLYRPLDMQQIYTEWTEGRAHGAASGYRYWFGVPMAGEVPVNRANLPAGAHTSASAENVTHFLIAQLGGGRFNTTAILSPASIAEMQRPVPRTADGAELHAMGWDRVMPIGNVTALIKNGASVNFNTMMILIPERRLGLVVLMNANKGLDSALGDERLLMLPYNVAELLLGQPPTVFAADPKPTLFYAILFLAMIVQAAGMARTVILLRRWPDQPDVRPQSRSALVRRLGLPLLCNLGWSLSALLGVPTLFGMPLSHIMYAAPDFGYTLMVSGAIALGWGIARTARMWWVLRTAQRGIRDDWHACQSVIRRGTGFPTDVDVVLPRLTGGSAAPSSESQQCCRTRFLAYLRQPQGGVL
jgi:CubicO group peptidase (beta-lactamase class C family)